MTIKRIWTLEDANAVLPRLKLIIGEQMKRAAEIDRLWKALRAMKVQPAAHQQLGVADDSSKEIVELELNKKLAAYDAGWQSVEELGVSVKDPRIGLCDFYGNVEGRRVWLCWQYGEDPIEFYHELDAGFAGRKPLGSSVRRRMLN